MRFMDDSQIGVDKKEKKLLDTQKNQQKKQFNKVNK